MINGRKTYDSYFKDRELQTGVKAKPNPTSTMFGRNTSGVLATNTDYGESVYDKNLNWGADINPDDISGSLNEFRANEQSAWAHLGIGATRTVAKAATEVAKLPGVIGGIAMSPFAAENEGFETAFNNQWIKFFDGLNEDVKEAMPVYIKESVANGDFFDKIGSSAFYATEGADGAGYMLGALAPGGLFKYFGGAAKMFGASIKAAKLAKYGEGIEAGRKAIKAAGITINNIDSYMIPAFNTIAEAGAEAKGVADDMDSRKGEFVNSYTNSNQFRQDINRRNALLDQQRRSGEITLDEYNKLSLNVENDLIESRFKEQKALAMQNTFIKNIAILAGPNYIQAKMLFGKTPSKVLLDKVLETEVKSGLKQSLKQAGKRVGQTFLSEGSEEVGQTSVQNRNVSQGLENKLGDDRVDDYNPLTFGKDFIKTLGTTEGQVAGFLGGILGSPISIVTGHRQDIADRKQTERLRAKINGESTAYRDVVNTNLYQQEEYVDSETGQIKTRDKVVNGEKVFIPENVAKVKNALDLSEVQSEAYDKAIEQGDIDTIEYLKGQAEFNLITKFIGEDQVTLDALHEYLKVAFPTEVKEGISEEQVKSNKENLKRVDNIMKKATQLQKDLISFKDMSTSVIRINNPEATPEHLEDFMNRLGYSFISERAEEYDAKQKLNALEKVRSELESNSAVIEIDNPNYIEGKTSEFDKTIKTRSNNPRLALVNKQIAKVKEQLKDFNEATNSTLWDNEWLNKKFDNEVKAKKKLDKNTSPENVQKAEEVSQIINKATTPQELNNLPKTNTDTDKVLQEQADAKKAELKAQKDAEEQAIRDAAKQEDVDFNQQSKTDITSTEGSEISDDLIPETNENNSPEEDKEANNPNPTEGKGVKLISYDRQNGQTFKFIEEQFPKGLEFERNPINKKGLTVGFEINKTPGVKLSEEALDRFNKGDFSDIQFLIDYLPINIKLAEDTYLPIETRRVTGEMNNETGMLRNSLIINLINGVPLESMSTVISGQYKGVLMVESPTAENSIEDIQGVTDLKYIRENLWFVNILGQLQNVMTGETKNFKNKFNDSLDRTKNNAAGEIYLEIPQADGSKFPLKLNISKLNADKSYTLASIYSHILKVEGSSEMVLSEIKDNELLNLINTNLDEELKVIGGNKQDVKLGEIIDLLVYKSDNPKSRIHLTDGILYYGENGQANSNNIDEQITEVAYFLNQSKRHQIKISPKSETDNTRTNLSSNSANYIKYLVSNKILSTNAVVGQPTFQGYTNLFIEPKINVKSENKTESTNKTSKFKPITNIEERLQGIRTLKELGEGFKALTPEQQEYYKPLFTQRKLELTPKQIKVSDAGAAIPSTGFEGLDFGDKKVVKTEPYTETNSQSIMGYKSQNTLENIRNSENNSVSLQEQSVKEKVNQKLEDDNVFVPTSKIPNTEENKTVKMKEEKIFNAPKNNLEKKKQLKTMELLLSKVKTDTSLTDIQLQQLDELKEMYPNEYKTKCK